MCFWFVSHLDTFTEKWFPANRGQPLPAAQALPEAGWALPNKLRRMFPHKHDCLICVGSRFAV
jgi:hypothetical protein